MSVLILPRWKARIHGRVTTILDDGSRIKEDEEEKEEGFSSLLGRSRTDTEKHGKTSHARPPARRSMYACGEVTNGRV